jgi:hypothetical protein
MSFTEKWKSKMDSYGNKDKRYKREDISCQQGASVPSVPFAVENEFLKNKDQGGDHTSDQAEEPQDTFQNSGEAVKVLFPALKGDLWLCSDAQARERVKYEGIPCFIFEDLQYIHQGRPGAERLARLQEVYAKKHTITESILDLFHGRIRSIKLKGEAQ